MSEIYNIYATKAYLQEKVDSVKTEIDATLTISGNAADAKATGDAIATTLTNANSYTDSKITEFVGI